MVISANRDHKDTHIDINYIGNERGGRVHVQIDRQNWKPNLIQFSVDDEEALALLGALVDLFRQLM